ncbi:g3952 [Coccomyxa elongata]
MGPPRTRIVDGEIVREDDIRLGQTSQRQPAQASSAPNPRAPQRPQRPLRGTGAFDFSAQPIALQREPPEQSLFGMPGLRIFGAHYQSKHLAALLAATVFLGLKGFLIGNAVWVFYKLSQTQGDARPAAMGDGAQQQGFQLPAFLQQAGFGPVGAAPGRAPVARPGSRPNFGQLGGQGTAQEEGGMSGIWGSAGNPSGGSAAAAVKDAWAGKGPGHKLGSSES